MTLEHLIMLFMGSRSGRNLMVVLLNMDMMLMLLGMLTQRKIKEKGSMDTLLAVLTPNDVKL